MIPGDLSDVPTLACLNKSQKRALILRDQLRYLEPRHLDLFLNGISNDEPPTYKTINGTACPPLAQVTIKEDATRFDLGNVQFPEEGGATYRAYLMVEDGRFEMRTEDPLPRDEAELRSVEIHRFVAENMLPLFKAKYKAIYARMEMVNEARRVAYNMLDQPPAKFEDGETLARLQARRSTAHEDATRDGRHRKHREITRHVSNKRQRIGLETIPDDVKSETFNAIPEETKVNLFNTIVKTAFPNFDNLIIASWNVVSVYSNVGSDFPELHKAVVELKDTLEEFESAYARPGIESGKCSKELASSLPPGAYGSPTSNLMPPIVTDEATTRKTQEDESASQQRSKGDEYDSHHQMPPPRIPPASPQHRHNDPEEPKRQPKPLTHTYTDSSSSTRAHSVPRNLPENSLRFSRPTPPSTPSSPHSHHLDLPRKRRARPIDSRRSPPLPSHLQDPGSELMRKRRQYTASLARANMNSKGAALGRRGHDEDEDE